ncbi:MAG: hypothetical protein WBR18_13570 [Anaerolineales bacterium]
MSTLKADPIEWLMSEDSDNPSVRYFALTDLLGAPLDSPEVVHAKQAIMKSGPVPQILEAQTDEGWWAKAGPGYSPKYRGTVWQVIFLAELGADGGDERVQRGVGYLLDHSIADNRAFSVYYDSRKSGTLHCLNGNLLWALIRLGWFEDPRVQAALAWQCRAIIGDDSVEYLRSGTCGPGFACGVNGGLPCAWGANKAMRALLEVPIGDRGPAGEAAIETAVSLLLSRDPAVADYPNASKVSTAWFRFGFPLSYWSDVLETVALLARAGQGQWPELSAAIAMILDKQDADGRWKMRNSLTGKMWSDIEARGKASKWVTLRALRALKHLGLYATTG